MRYFPIHLSTMATKVKTVSHLLMQYGPQRLILPKHVHGRSRSNYVHVLAVVILMFIFLTNLTQLLPLQPQRTFLLTLSSHVTVVSRSSAVTIYQQMLRPTWIMNTECNMATEILFTLGRVLFRYRITFSVQFINAIQILTNFVQPERNKKSHLYKDSAKFGDTSTVAMTTNIQVHVDRFVKCK